MRRETVPLTQANGPMFYSRVWREALRSIGDLLLGHPVVPHFPAALRRRFRSRRFFSTGRRWAGVLAECELGFLPREARFFVTWPGCCSTAMS